MTPFPVAQICVVALALLVAVSCPLGAQEAGGVVTGTGGVGDEEAVTQYQLADGLLKRRFHDMAEAEFRAFLERHGGHALAPAAAYGLVQCLHRQGRADEAVAQIQAFRARWPTDALASRLTLVQGDILLQQGKVAEAASCFDALLQDADVGTREAAEYFAAQCQEKQGDAPGATAGYERLAARPFVPESPYRAYAALALAAYREASAAEAAAGLFDRLAAEGNVPEDVREEALFRRARLAFAAKDWDSVIERAGRLVLLAPESRFAAVAARLRVRAALEAGRPKQAAALAEEWRQRHPAPDLELDALDGPARLAAEDFAGALACFERVIAGLPAGGDPHRRALHGRLACLLRMGRYAEVGPAAEEFLKRYAEDDLAADVLYFQGIAAQETGRHDAAAAALDRAVTAVAGRRDWIYFEDACVRLAAALEKTGKLREAAASYRQLAAGKDADTAARLLLQAAEWLQKAGDTDGAAAEFAKVFNQAKAGTGERRIAALRLARLEIGREQPAQAEKVLVQYLGDAPQAERGDAMLLLGYAQSRQARYPEAVATFRAFLDTPQPARLAAEGRYMLALTHLEAGQDDEAFALLTGLWQLPAETRPVFSRPVLLRLQEVAFQRNQYAVSEQIGRHLMESGTGEDAWQARLRLAETLMALNRHDEAAALLDETVDPTASRATPPPEPLVQDAWALLGEIALGKGERGRAYHAFEKSLARPGTSARTTVRGRWGKAKVLSDEGRAADALRHAVSAFVVGDDPVYTPRAMLLAIELLAGQGRLDEARATWEELGRRYPAVAEQNRGQPFVLRLTSPAMP